MPALRVQIAQVEDENGDISGDGRVGPAAWRNYYNGVSFAYESDTEFEQAIRNAWGVQGLVERFDIEPFSDFSAK